MGVLAIDLGDKQCGIAVLVDGIAFPKDIVMRSKIVKILKKYIGIYHVETIVVGLPYDLYNVKTKQLLKTQSFIEKLRDIFPLLEIVGVDERYSSIEAKEYSDHMKKGSRLSKRDDIAAQIILERYIDQVKNIKRT